MGTQRATNGSLGIDGDADRNGPDFSDLQKTSLRAICITRAGPEVLKICPVVA
jgi:hypothetical protein